VQEVRKGDDISFFFLAGGWMMGVGDYGLGRERGRGGEKWMDGWSRDEMELV